MTTTSRYSFEAEDSSVLELQVEKTQVLQSTLEKVIPFQMPLLGDNGAFPRYVLFCLEHCVHFSSNPFTINFMFIICCIISVDKH